MINLHFGVNLSVDFEGFKWPHDDVIIISTWNRNCVSTGLHISIKSSDPLKCLCPKLFDPVYNLLCLENLKEKVPCCSKPQKDAKEYQFGPFFRMLLPFTTNSFQTDPNYNDFSHHWYTITVRRESFLKTLLKVKITSGHLLSEECDHLGEVDWSWGLSNLRRRQFMAILLSAERLGSVWTKIWKKDSFKNAYEESPPCCWPRHRWLAVQFPAAFIYQSCHLWGTCGT